MQRIIVRSRAFALLATTLVATIVAAAFPLLAAAADGGPIGP